MKLKLHSDFFFLCVFLLHIAETADRRDSDAARLHAGAHFGTVPSYESSQVKWCHCQCFQSALLIKKFDCAMAFCCEILHLCLDFVEKEKKRGI